MNACPNVRPRHTFAMKCQCASCVELRRAASAPGRRAIAAMPRAERAPKVLPPFMRPLAWHDEPDEIAVERVLGGDRPAVLAAADRLEVVRVATARGESAAQIAARLRVSPRTVVRYRGRLAA